MPFRLLHDFFPDVAERETRTVIVLPKSRGPLPPGEYALCEMFCDERGCDCRRVLLNVITSASRGTEALISFGWEDKAFYAEWARTDDGFMIDHLRGPALDPLSPQSARAPIILDMVTDLVLSDQAYVERVKRHYAMVRQHVESHHTEHNREHRQRKRRRSRR